jgi:hypothetical protein
MKKLFLILFLFLGFKNSTSAMVDFSKEDILNLALGKEIKIEFTHYSLENHKNFIEEIEVFLKLNNKNFYDLISTKSNKKLVENIAINQSYFNKEQILKNIKDNFFKINSTYYFPTSLGEEVLKKITDSEEAYVMEKDGNYSLFCGDEETNTKVDLHPIPVLGKDHILDLMKNNFFVGIPKSQAYLLDKKNQKILSKFKENINSAKTAELVKINNSNDYKLVIDENIQKQDDNENEDLIIQLTPTTTFLKDATQFLAGSWNDSTYGNNKMPLVAFYKEDSEAEVMALNITDSLKKYKTQIKNACDVFFFETTRGFYTLVIDGIDGKVIIKDVGVAYSKNKVQPMNTIKRKQHNHHLYPKCEFNEDFWLKIYNKHGKVKGDIISLQNEYVLVNLKD